MTIETIRSKYSLWIGYSRMIPESMLQMVTEDKVWSQQMAKKLLHNSRDVAAVS